MSVVAHNTVKCSHNEGLKAFFWLTCSMVFENQAATKGG